MNQDFDTLSHAKNRDSETALYKHWDCKTHINSKKMTLQDVQFSPNILEDSELLQTVKDHLQHLHSAGVQI